ncbi:MAG TPA: hypothetical protein VFE42_25275 [Chloroflexota bacterium]|nr:hypothetical protein [Chloroflexota bacterium]
MLGMHGPDERIRRDDLYRMRDLMLAIVEQAARWDGAPGSEWRKGNEGADTNV